MSTEIIFLSLMLLFSFLNFVLVPGVIVVAILALIYAFITSFSVLTVTHVFVFLSLGVLGSFFDNVLSALGAKKFGSSRYGVIGAFLGTLIFLIFTGPGAVIGPFVGAFIAEIMFAKKDVDSSLRAAVGATIGLFTGVFAKFLLSILLTIWFGVIVF